MSVGLISTALSGPVLFLPEKWEVIPGSFPEICPGLNANEIQIPYDKHHKVSSLVKSHQNTHNSVKYEVV